MGTSQSNVAVVWYFQFKSDCAARRGGGFAADLPNKNPQKSS
jgi:hypothetical protein